MFGLFKILMSGLFKGKKKDASEVTDFFTNKNCEGEGEECFSPKGRYKLIVKTYKTKKGCWDYTKGYIYRVSDNKLIQEVPRNYGCFPYEFVEDHVDGHDYIFCGEDYQGHTLIQLDTGKKYNFIHKGASKGFGFCWSDMYVSPDNNYLLVDGCYWACPYETRIYDISDPLNMRLVHHNNDDPNMYFKEWINDDTILVEVERCKEDENGEDIWTTITKEFKLNYEDLGEIELEV